MRVLHPRHAAHLEWLRTWARLLDNRFQVPGTRVRFGLDPILGVLPVVGDVATVLFSGAAIVLAFRMGIPAIVQARMVVNVVIDVLVGEIPILGDLFDFAWKSNTMNLALLERHAYEVVRPSTSDWVVVIGALVVLAACVAIPLAVLVWVVHALQAVHLL